MDAQNSSSNRLVKLQVDIILFACQWLAAAVSTEKLFQLSSI